LAEKSIPHTTSGTGDGPSGGFSAAQAQEMYRYINSQSTATGWTAAGYVFRGELGELAVTGTASPVGIAAGSGIVYGVWYLNDAATTLAIPTPVTNPRIDRVILRYSSAAQTVRITRLAGTEAASPSAPALTQNSTTFEVSLARVGITTGGTCTVTDERVYAVNPGALGAADGTTLTVASNKLAINSTNVTTFGGVAVGSAAASTGNVQAKHTADALFAAETTNNANSAYVSLKTPSKQFLISASGSGTASPDEFYIYDNTAGAKRVSISSTGAVSIPGSLAVTGTATVGTSSVTGNETVGGNTTVTGQITSTKSGTGAASGVYVSSAQPTIALNETDQGADAKRWDLVASGGILALRAINDADSSATNALVVQRSGSTVSSLSFGANTAVSGTLSTSGTATLDSLAVTNSATVSGNLTVSGTVSLPANSIQTAEIQDAQITAAKLANDAVTTVKILDANITTAKLATNSVDDTIVGNRVPMFTDRQGGSATDWNTPGTTNRVPTTVKTQGGAIGVVFAAASSAVANVTFPAGFSAKPLVIVASEYSPSFVNITTPTTTGFAIQVTLQSGTYTGTVTVHWLAIGPE